RAGANPRHTEHEVGLDSSAHFMHVVMDAELKRNHGFQSVEHTVCSGDQVHTTEELEDVANCVADWASNAIRDHVASRSKCHVTSANSDHVPIWEHDNITAASWSIRRSRENFVFASCSHWVTSCHVASKPDVILTVLNCAVATLIIANHDVLELCCCCRYTASKCQSPGSCSANCTEQDKGSIKSCNWCNCGRDGD